MVEGCVFRDHDRLRAAELYIENDSCIYSTRDPRDPPDVIPGCGAIVPKVHRASPFDLTAEEWTATRELLLLVRAELHKRFVPDGYTLGWNDQGGLHPHLHVIPRLDDEPMADHGVRSGMKIPPIGDLIRGAAAPGGTWPDHETSSGSSPALISGTCWSAGAIAWLRHAGQAPRDVLSDRACFVGQRDAGRGEPGFDDGGQFLRRRVK
jgi:diadenosine tetraphosphate (Ap4A) HIT family hydrolase